MENQVAVNPEFLNSWKEIASYMGRGVRTVQRWEELYGLPVRRVNGRRSGRGNHSPVISTRSEIDAWFTARGAVAKASTGSSPGRRKAMELGPRPFTSVGLAAEPPSTGKCSDVVRTGDMLSQTRTATSSCPARH